MTLLKAMPGRLACAAIVISAMVWATACADGERRPTLESPVTEAIVIAPSPIIQSDSAPGEPPFESLDQLVERADVAVIARIEEVTSLTEASDERGNGKIWFQDSTAIVERVVFGPATEELIIRNTLYAGPTAELRLPTRAPAFEEGERVLVFLERRGGPSESDQPVYETVGGGVLWGKYSVKEGMVAGRSSGSRPLPLETVAKWVRDARAALTKPGAIGGAVSGLDAGDEVTLRLLRLVADTDVVFAEVLESWVQGNGRWESGAVRLREGEYAVEPQVPGYVPVTRQHRFQVPPEGYSWTYRGFEFEMFRPERAAERFGAPLCDAPRALWPETANVETPTVSPASADARKPAAGTCYGGYFGTRLHVAGGIGGHISLAEGATAIVRVQRLPRDPLLDYSDAPTPDGPFPRPLIEIADPASFGPVKTVFELVVDEGRWGVIDETLGGHPYLVTIEAANARGYEVRPAGYQVVVFGGRAPYIVRDVNFLLRAPDLAPPATQLPAATPDLAASPPPPPVAMPTPTPTPALAPFIGGTSDILFVMKNRYQPGEPVEIRIRNQSATATYYYQRFYPACYNLKFFDSSDVRRPYPHEDPQRATTFLLPGQFIVPRGTHCDRISELPLKPGESVAVFTWEQDVCVRDRWGCLESRQVEPGEYRIVGEFAQQREVLEYADRAGARIAAAEWKFVIQAQQ